MDRIFSNAVKAHGDEWRGTTACALWDLGANRMARAVLDSSSDFRDGLLMLEIQKYRATGHSKSWLDMTRVNRPALIGVGQ